MIANLSDVAALVISISLSVAYYVFLRWRLRSDPHHTMHAVNRIARDHWVHAIMTTPGQELLAVQTLRNSVMTASFMASTAILLIVGTLTFAGSQEHAGTIWHALNVSGATDDTVVALKLVLLLADFFIAFFCFSMAMRFFNHVGYLITAPGATADAFAPERVAAYLNRAGNFYAVGTRAFFY
ncbi:MAG: DUF599 domain-containing protein, partial [Burkholderiales bacterium]